MKREFSDEFISAYLDGELAPEEARRAEQLLLDSAEHRKLFAELRDIRSKIRELPQAKLAADFSRRVLESAKRELHADSQPRVTTSPKKVAATSETRVPQKSIGLPPQRRGWLAAVSLAATAAAVVVALLAFPPDFSQIGSESVAMAPEEAKERDSTESVSGNDPIKNTNQEQSVSVATSQPPQHDDLADEDNREYLHAGEQQWKQGPESNLLNLVKDRERSANKKSPMDKIANEPKPAASTQNRPLGMPGELGIPGEIAGGGFHLEQRESLSRNLHESDNKTKINAKTRGIDLSIAGDRSALQEMPAMADDSSATIPPLLVSPDAFRSAQTAGLKLAIVELSDVVSDESFAHSLHDHRVRLDRLDSIGGQNVQRFAGKNAESDPPAADAYQLAILEGEPQNIAAALAEFEIQSQPVAAPMKSRWEEAEAGQAAVPLASAADQANEDPAGSPVEVDALADSPFGADSPQPASPSFAAPAVGGIATNSAPPGRDGNGSYGVAGSTTRPLSQPEELNSRPEAKRDGGATSDSFGINRSPVGQYRNPAEKGSRDEAKIDRVLEESPDRQAGFGGGGADTSEPVVETEKQASIRKAESLRRSDFADEKESGLAADFYATEESPPAPAEEPTTEVTNATVRLLVLIRRKQPVPPVAADAAETTRQD